MIQILLNAHGNRHYHHHVPPSTPLFLILPERIFSPKISTGLYLPIKFRFKITDMVPRKANMRTPSKVQNHSTISRRKRDKCWFHMSGQSNDIKSVGSFRFSEKRPKKNQYINLRNLFQGWRVILCGQPEAVDKMNQERP